MSDLFEQLKKEHREVESLLKKATGARGAERTKLLEQIEENLIPHARAEEKTLYAALREVSSDGSKVRDLTNEAYEEHRLVDQMLKDLKDTPTNDETWQAKLTVLKENVRHHVEEEEEKIFPKARRVFTDEDTRSIFDAYLKAKQQYQESLPTQGQISERTPYSRPLRRAVG